MLIVYLDILSLLSILIFVLIQPYVALQQCLVRHSII